MLEKAGESYRTALENRAARVAYLKGRGCPVKLPSAWPGFAPEGGEVWPGFQITTILCWLKPGLVIVNEEDGKRYDRFRDRVMFPIRNIKGECIGFGGRVMGDGTPKYLNSPETPVFHKGRELYGLFEARDSIHAEGYVLVTEGYMDVVALAQWGFPNAVATLGTACTPDHVQKLFRFTDAVVSSTATAQAASCQKSFDGSSAMPSM